MKLVPRRLLSFVEDIYEEGATRVDVPHRKAAVVAVLQNPFAGTVGADLSEGIKASAELGGLVGRKLMEAMGDFPVQGYGKGGLVGLGGEPEHANALLTTTFANPIRDLIGGAQAWISSFQKMVPPYATIDIPMNHKDDVYVRSHYDGMTIYLPNGPQTDEVAVIFCATSRGRLNARVGGLTHEEVMARQ